MNSKATTKIEEEFIMENVSKLEAYEHIAGIIQEELKEVNHAEVRLDRDAHELQRLKDDHSDTSRRLLQTEMKTGFERSSFFDNKMLEHSGNEANLREMSEDVDRRYRELRATSEMLKKEAMFVHEVISELKRPTRRALEERYGGGKFKTKAGK